MKYAPKSEPVEMVVQCFYFNELFHHSIGCGYHFQTVPTLEHPVTQLAVAGGHPSWLRRVPHLRRGEGETPEVHTQGWQLRF